MIGRGPFENELAMDGRCQSKLFERIDLAASPREVTQRSPFWNFKTSSEIIRLAVMLYVRYGLEAAVG